MTKIISFRANFNLAYITVQAKDKDEADKFVDEKYGGTTFSCMNKSYTNSFEKCHYVYAERVGLHFKTRQVIVRRYCYKIHQTPNK